jgi:hypothetical protein
MHELRETRTDNESTAAWLGTLPAQERAVADTALRLHTNFVRRFEFMGGGYLMAFFLKQYLQRELQISSNVVVGYVRDRVGTLRIPHAWLEHKGRKVDVALTLTEDACYRPTGDLLILDASLWMGEVRYAYHLEDSGDSVRSAASACLASLEFAVTHQQRTCEHAAMRVLASDDEAMWNYMLQAPPRLSYCAISRAIAR